MPTNKQRREAARRHLERQLQRRQERDARRRKVTLITSVALTLVLIGAIVLAVVLLSSGNGTSTNQAAATPTPSSPPVSSPTSSAAVASYPCTWLPADSGPATKHAKLPPTTTPPKKGVATVSVQTTQGPITFRLNRAGSPCTVANFLSLVAQKFYDKSSCHRLVTSGIYVLQCGDPSGTGQGGPGYSVPDEATGKETYPAGTIAMARSSAAHSGGSQFFIVYKNSPNLMQHLGPLQYTVFGKVAAGLNVVKKVAAAGAAGTSGDGKPKLPITITSMKAKS